MAGSWKLVVGKRAGLGRVAGQALEAAWKIKAKGWEAVALRVKEVMDAEGTGPWHVIIGPAETYFAMKLHKQRMFVFGLGGELQAVICQSAPLTPLTPEASATAAPTDNRPKSKYMVLSGDMPVEVRDVAAALFEDALEREKGLTAMVLKLRESLSCRYSPMWQIAVCKGELGLAVEAEKDTFADLKIKGYRVAMWKHSLEVSPISGMRIAELLFIPLFALAAVCMVFYAISMSKCKQCCRSSNLQSGAGTSTEQCDPTMCSSEDVVQADACLLRAGRIGSCTIGLVVTAFTLRGIVRHLKRREKLKKRQ